MIVDKEDFLKIVNNPDDFFKYAKEHSINKPHISFLDIRYVPSLGNYEKVKESAIKYGYKISKTITIPIDFTRQLNKK
jgi:hypothetical protein